MASLNLRLPESLHAKIRLLAEQDGVSLNQFIMLAVAEKAAVLELGATNYLSARAARVEGDASKQLRDLLSEHGGDVEPLEEDRL
ncbi:MAG: toxin-antitoxin system HicB family antitoxin [Bacteroidota bacterium]